MQDQPMGKMDQSKIIFFCILLLPAICLGVGVLPAIFLAFGWYMMKKNQDFSYLELAVKGFRGYVSLILIGSGLCLCGSLISSIGNRFYGEIIMLFFACLAIALAYLFVMQSLFYAPISKHGEWVAANGFLLTKTKGNKDFKQKSIVDDLVKLVKLKEDGHISEHEFNAAKANILKIS